MLLPDLDQLPRFSRGFEAFELVESPVDPVIVREHLGDLLVLLLLVVLNVGLLFFLVLVGVGVGVVIQNRRSSESGDGVSKTTGLR